MSATDEFLNASEAARRLGVSAKALRLYEERGLVRPLRSEAGWRTFGPVQMERAAEVAALRALGLSLAQVAAVLNGDAATLDAALAAHQGALDGRMKDIAGAMERVRALRARLAEGRTPEAGAVAGVLGEAQGLAFELPWPWGGERFSLSRIAPITYIVGPLGSGKTRLAQAIAAAIPGGVFVGLDRTAVLDDPAVSARVEETVGWLVEEGATLSEALLAVVAALERDGPSALVFDLIEQGLDQPTQEALVSLLRHRANPARPLFLMTRSSAFLELEAVGANEAIILCPANHSPPVLVAPYPGAPGYEAVATCLANPEVRKRTEGTVAVRPGASR